MRTPARRPTRGGIRGGGLFVAEGVLSALREHALTAPDGHEIGGWLVLRDGRVERYHPVANEAEEPALFVWPEGDGGRPAGDDAYAFVPVHSHPWSGPSPSAADIEALACYVAAGGDPPRQGIYSVRLDQLAVWGLDEDGDAVAVPLRVGRASSRRPVMRPGRR